MSLPTTRVKFPKHLHIIRHNLKVLINRSNFPDDIKSDFKNRLRDVSSEDRQCAVRFAELSAEITELRKKYPV